MEKNKPEYVLALDPSGNYHEGKGTTGWCLLHVETLKPIKFGYLKASKYGSQFEYWQAHLELIDNLFGYKPVIVVEDYMLYQDQAQVQINSRFETPKLIGVIEYECFLRGIEIHLQPAVLVKRRWADNILVHKGILTKEGNKYCVNGAPCIIHTRDSIRHAAHYASFKIRR